MSLKFLFMLIKIGFVIVMIFGVMLGNSCNISWISVFVGGCLMGILGVIIGAQEKNNKK